MCYHESNTKNNHFKQGLFLPVFFRCKKKIGRRHSKDCISGAATFITTFVFMTILDEHINDIKSLCFKYNVKRLFAFGSVLTERFDDKSDIDFIVDFELLDHFSYVDNYYNLKFSLEDKLQRKVDLLEEKAIKNPYFQQMINQKRQLIYGH